MARDKKLSRRGLFGGTAAAAALTFGAGTQADAAAPAETPAAQPVDLRRRSAALEPDKVVRSACQFCNSLCALNVSLKQGRILEVRGETADPVQNGGLCVKGERLMTEIVYSPRRLTTPMRRKSGAKGSADTQFEPISWDTALETIASRLLELRRAGKAHTIASKTSGRLPRGTGSLIARFFELLGSPNDTDVGPVCNDAGGNALAWTFGLGNFTNGYGRDESTGREDLGSAKCFLFFGTNQAETHPVTFDYLLRQRARTKAKLIVVDPRLTPTGASADEWVAPKPHTDLALALAILSHVIERGLYDRRFVDRWVLGFDELKRHLKEHQYTPEWAESVTGIGAAKIRSIAETYATAKPAAIFCNAGISHQLNAFDTYRVLAFLAAVTGNVGVNGGGCNFMHNTWPGGLNLPALAVSTPKRREALPVGPDSFAESILTAKPYKLEALISMGNPLLGSANTARVQQAFEQLGFYVYTGLFLEESAWYADIILPVCSGFEMSTVYMRRDDRAIRWQDQAVARVGSAKPDWEIWIDLAHTMARFDKENPPEYWTSAFRPEWRDYANLWDTFVKNTPGMGGMTRTRMAQRKEPLRWPCPDERHPGVSTLYLDHPSWAKAAEALNPKNKGKRFLTPSGKVEIFTPEIEAKLASAGHTALPVFYTHPEVSGTNATIEYLPELVTNPVNPHALTPKVRLGKRTTSPDGFPLMGMIGRASVVHFAGVTQWTPTGKQMNGVRFIQIHPKAAQAAGIANGDTVRVTSPHGSVTGSALLWEGIREDTIFVPNSFGPRQVLSRESGAPEYEAANLLTSDRYFDNLSGQQAYKCFACKIAKA